jgi:hypothetical protein
MGPKDKAILSDAYSHDCSSDAEGPLLVWTELPYKGPKPVFGRQRVAFGSLSEAAQLRRACGLEHIIGSYERLPCHEMDSPVSWAHDPFENTT